MVDPTSSFQLKLFIRLVAIIYILRNYGGKALQRTPGRGPPSPSFQPAMTSNSLKICPRDCRCFSFHYVCKAIASFGQIHFLKLARIFDCSLIIIPDYDAFIECKYPWSINQNHAKTTLMNWEKNGGNLIDLINILSMNKPGAPILYIPQHFYKRSKALIISGLQEKITDSYLVTKVLRLIRKLLPSQFSLNG